MNSIRSLPRYSSLIADNRNFSFVDAVKLDTPNKQPWAIMRDDHR
jgi:hypothetical protein